MKKMLGIDIGTSGTKVAVINRHADILSKGIRSYDIDLKENGGAEQDPDVWWKAVADCIKECDISGISAIGLSGQMHGLVALDNNGKVIRPAIIWADKRTVLQVQRINEYLKAQDSNNIINRATTGFLLPSLLWLKEKEPEEYKRIYKVMLPKDYIRYKFTGNIYTDPGDASGTGAFDIVHLTWDEGLIKALGLEIEMFPKIIASDEIAGEVSKNASKETGLPCGIPVVCGSGDHTMQLVGNAIVKNGIMNSNIGTASQLSLTAGQTVNDTLMRTNIFCHAVGGLYNIVGAGLNGGIVLKWLKNMFFQQLNYGELDRKAIGIPAGSDGLVFLPYLSGERTPHHNPYLKGIMHGLTLGHTDGHIIRSAMEGVIFCLRDSLEIFKSLGIQSSFLIASGGGARSKVWLQMQADIFESDIYICNLEEQATVGAALIAGLGTGIYSSADEIYETLKDRILPAAHPYERTVAIYNDSYEGFKEIYNCNHSLFTRSLPTCCDDKK